MTEAQPWYRELREVDRLLDGEASPEEAAELRAVMAREPEVRRLVERRGAFLGVLRQAAASDAARTPSPDLAALEARVRAALAEDRIAAAQPLRIAGRRPRIAPWTWAASAAAVLLVGLGLAVFSPAVRDADAMPREALLAADLVRNAPTAEGSVATCGAQLPTSPFRFPLVERREMGVKGCVDPDPGVAEQALLYRVADLDVVGYVAVPDAGAGRGPEIGVTRLPDVVVFDVRLGGAAYYLAVHREKVDRQGMCAACHGTSRTGDKNPHLFTERRLPRKR